MILLRSPKVLYSGSIPGRREFNKSTRGSAEDTLFRDRNSIDSLERVVSPTQSKPYQTFHYFIISHYSDIQRYKEKIRYKDTNITKVFSVVLTKD